MAHEGLDVLIAKDLGQPLDYNLKVSPVLSEIANIETAQPGELVRIFNYTGEDASADDIYTADANGALTAHKVSAVSPATLTFAGLQSTIEYVLINEVLPAVDQNALARKKAGIGRAMDKEELYRILNAILALDGGTGEPDLEVVQATGDDLYDLIDKMVTAVEDYADDYVLLASASVFRAIRNYDKDNSTVAAYRVGLDTYLENAGIKVIKVKGAVIDTGGTHSVLLASGKMILIGRNSEFAAGKPITFVRRLMTPEIAKAMNSESAERAISIANAPVPIVSNGSGTLGWACFGYESVIEAICNYKAICFASYTA